MESAVYFAVSELLANASRYASKVTIDISRRGRALRVTVADDGPGGAVGRAGRGTGRHRTAAGAPSTACWPCRAHRAAPPRRPSRCSTRSRRRRGGRAGQRAAEAAGAGCSTGSAGVCAWLPLFPQGLVATFMLIFQPEERSWFLALLHAAPFQWPTVAFMIALGATDAGHRHPAEPRIHQKSGRMLTDHEGRTRRRPPPAARGTRPPAPRP